jgi:hypothetical protein
VVSRQSAICDGLPCGDAGTDQAAVGGVGARDHQRPGIVGKHQRARGAVDGGDERGVAGEAAADRDHRGAEGVDHDAETARQVADEELDRGGGFGLSGVPGGGDRGTRQRLAVQGGVFSVNRLK